jgi:DNA-directed RNA polymerase specialized sigma24 family protein
MVLEAYEEHGVVKLVLGQLPQVDPEDERFHAKMTVLKEMIEHHVQEEEGEMFKLLAKIPADQREALAQQMLEEAEVSEPAGKRPPRGSRRAA